MSIVEFNNVTRVYTSGDHELKALSGASFTLEEGKFVVILVLAAIVLGFRDKHIGKLLISQNIRLTVIGVLLGIPAGVGVLYVLVAALVSEYELSVTLGMLTYFVSILLTFGVSLIVSLMVAAKNKKINMVEALKGAE